MGEVDIVFEVELDYTFKDMLRYIRFHRKTRQKTAYVLRFIANIVIAAFLLFAYAFTIRTGGQNGELLSRLLLFTALAVLLQFTDHLTAFFSIKNFRSAGASHGRTEEECFVIWNDKAKSEYAYSGFTDLLYSKKNQAYYCYLAKKVALVIPERCFTKGDPTAFGAFLAGKTGLEVREIK